MEEISQFVSNVGFPIVACIFMYFNQKELNKSISELSSTLKGIDTRLDILERDNLIVEPVIGQGIEIPFENIISCSVIDL